MSEPGLITLGGMTVNPATQVSKGEFMVSIPVRQGITGVLANDIRGGHHEQTQRSVLPDAPLMSAGQVVYGVKITTGARQIVWCAPRRSETGSWKAVCFPTDGLGHVWVESAPAMMAGSHLVMPEGGRSYVTPPKVERRAVDLPPMTMSYVFEGWDKSDIAKINVCVDWGEGSQTYKELRFRPEADGGVVVAAFGGKLEIRNGDGPDKAIVTFSAR
jgi:hypothetical protein